MVMHPVAVVASRAGRELLPPEPLILRVQFQDKVDITKFKVPPESRMTRCVAAPRRHNGPAAMPTAETIRVDSKIARNREKRLQAEVGSRARTCSPAQQSSGRPLATADDDVFPCMMMSTLTVLVFCLPPDSGEKIALGVTVLLAFSGMPSFTFDFGHIFCRSKRVKLGSISVLQNDIFNSP